MDSVGVKMFTHCKGVDCIGITLELAQRSWAGYLINYILFIFLAMNREGSLSRGRTVGH